MRLHPAMALLALAPVAVPSLAAQTWRTMDVSRQAHDTAAIAAHIDYAAGKLDLKPAAGGALYRATVRYDADRAEPVAAFNASSRVLDLGVHLRGMHISDNGDANDAGSMQAELSAAVPVDLSLELGAVEADLQLGGLRLTDLALRSGAADITARFNKPNPEPLRTMTLQVGAAEVKVLDAANSGVSRIVAEVGAGSLSIDLGGVLTRDVDITATLALGGLELSVAPDDGVFVDERTLLGSFAKDGFTKRADGWYSDNYDAAARHVRVHLHAFLGSLKLSRVQK
ncbi:MAG TPA: hypothetical protein VGI97_03965 [Gemmatimonadaceae bacterium]